MSPGQHEDDLSSDSHAERSRRARDVKAVWRPSAARVGQDAAGAVVGRDQHAQPQRRPALAIPHHYAFTSGWLGDRMITRSDPDPRHFAAAAAELAPATAVRLTVPGERTSVP